MKSHEALVSSVILCIFRYPMTLGTLFSKTSVSHSSWVLLPAFFLLFSEFVMTAFICLRQYTRWQKHCCSTSKIRNNWELQLHQNCNRSSPIKQPNMLLTVRTFSIQAIHFQRCHIISEDKTTPLSANPTQCLTFKHPMADLYKL